MKKARELIYLSIYNQAVCNSEEEVMALTARVLRELSEAGFVIVPKEPTVEMLVAAQEEWMCVRAAEDRGDFIWRAMLEAAQ